MGTETAGEQHARQLVVFTLGPDAYGVPIAMVQEIIRHTPARRIPGSPSHVLGVINLRGRIIPVVDLRARLGMATDPPADAKIVVLEMSEFSAGVLVDQVREVLTVGADRCEPPPGDAGHAGYIDAVARLEGRPVVILDMPCLLSDAA
jgi:purine-binding chemotaxis protein CheW